VYLTQSEEWMKLTEEERTQWKKKLSDIRKSKDALEPRNEDGKIIKWSDRGKLNPGPSMEFKLKTIEKHVEKLLEKGGEILVKAYEERSKKRKISEVGIGHAGGGKKAGVSKNLKAKEELTQGKLVLVNGGGKAGKYISIWAKKLTLTHHLQNTEGGEKVKVTILAPFTTAIIEESNNHTFEMTPIPKLWTEKMLEA